MYIPIGTVPSSLDQLKGDLERRQRQRGAASVASASTNGAQSVASNNTNSTRGRGPARPAPAPRVPVGNQPRSIEDLVSDLETRQVRGDAPSVASVSTNGAQSVASNNTNRSRGRGPARTTPAPRVRVGQQPRSIDDLVSDLETRQNRGDAASVASASTNGAQSVASNNTSLGRGRGPARTTPAPRVRVGQQPRSIDDLVFDLEIRQNRGGASSVASVSTNGAQSVQSNDSKPAAGRQPRPGRAPAGRQPRSIDELWSDVRRRQVGRGRAGGVASASSNDADSVRSANTNANTNTTRGGARQPAPPPRIPIGAQPRSLAELVGDLERRQVTGGDAASVSSGSSKKSKGAKSAKSAGKSSAATPAPTASASIQPPAAQPTSAPAVTSTPAVAPPAAPAVTSAPAVAPPAAPAPRPIESTSASEARPVQNPAVSSSSVPLPAVPSPSPTTLSTRVSPPATPLPDLFSSSTSAAGPIATVLPPASEIPAGETPIGSANSEIAPAGGSPMDTGVAIGIVFASIIAAAILGGFIVVCCVRRQRAKRERESQIAASQWPNEKAQRPDSNWEDRLYGSANRSTGAGFSEKAKSIFVVPFRFMSGNRGGQEPPPVLPNLPMPPRLGGGAGPASTRYSKRSTGLTTLDETQFKTYNNLVGRSNPKKPVAFDNPYFQQDEWK